jgi:hypothetical protein
LEAVADHVDNAADHPPVIDPHHAAAGNAAISAPSGARSAETNHPSRPPLTETVNHISVGINRS